jgi:NAD(P)H dehydrogenase (quinone)
MACAVIRRSSADCGDGATGRLGRQIVEILAAGEHQVVGVSRRVPPAALRGPRVRAVVADYADPVALRESLRGVDTLVLVSSDGEAVRVLRHHLNVIQAAADSGVGHIVALSGLDADPESPFCYAVTYAYTEQLLYHSGGAVSIARASLFTEFFTELLGPARASKQIRLPAGAGRISLVSRADVGRCLAALATAAPTGQHHDITGPEALDLTTIAALAGRRWGTSVSYIDMEPAEYQIEALGNGLDPWWCYAFASMFASVRERRWESVSGEVLRLTGQPPTSFQNMLADEKAVAP